MMKRKLVLRTVVLSAALAAAVTFTAVRASGGEDDLVAHIAEGRKAFVRICGSCHGVDKPEKKNADTEVAA